MMELRRVYMRAISVPTQSLESLAKDYEAFENSYDKKFARTLLAESAPKLFACKSAYKEREKLNEQLFEGLGYDVKVYKNGIAIGDPVHTSKAADCHLDAFRRFIAWEKTNPQKLEGVGVVSALKKTENKPEEDPPRVRERIALAYEKCLLTCENYPEVWLEYSNWHENAGRSGDAAEILMRARTVLPGSIMLVLAAADLEESQQNIEGMKAVYESYMTAYEEKRESEKLAEGEGSAIVKMMDDDTSVVYSEYIRACRRSDSQASSRKAFLRARKAPGCSWLVYATAALLEWRYDEADKPCRNVFELGLKSYMHVPSYVLTYTNHLISLGDVGNSRVVFERALSVERPDISIFDAFVKFEHEYGSYESFRDAENRRSEFLEPSLSVLGSSRLTVAKLVQNVFERHNFLPDVAPLQSESLPHYAKLGVSSIQKFMALSIASGKKELSRAKLPPPPKAPKGAPPPPPKKTSVALASASAGDDGARAEQPESTNSVAGTTAQRAAPPSIGLSALPVVVAPPLPETLRELFNKLPGPVAFAKMPAPRVDAVLDALKQSDLTIEGKAELLAKMQGKDSRPQSNGSKRTASQMLATDAMGSEPSVSFKQPTKDVFKERQSKMQKASAEFQ
jgi:cleavage stimulation factor subunit 3